MLKHRYGVRTEYPLWLLVCCSIVHRHFNWIQLLLCCRSVYCSSFRFLTTTGLPILESGVNFIDIFKMVFTLGFVFMEDLR